MEEEEGLSSTFVSPSGRLCSTLVLMGKPRYTMLDVEPRCFYHLCNLTKKEIDELTWKDIGLSSRGL